MICERCNISIKEGEEKKHKGKTLCEDCCMDILSPKYKCDPWATYCAKSDHNESFANIDSHLDSESTK